MSKIFFRHLRWSVPALIAGLAFGIWAVAQPVITEQSPPPDQQPAVDLSPIATTQEEVEALDAFHRPHVWAAEKARHKTQEEEGEEQSAILAISQPAVFSAQAEKFKDNDRKNKDRQAVAAILNPAQHSGSVERLKEEHRRKKEAGEEVDEILDPKYVSGNIPGKPASKSPLKVK